MEQNILGELLHARIKNIVQIEKEKDINDMLSQFKEDIAIKKGASAN